MYSWGYFLPENFRSVYRCKYARRWMWINGDLFRGQVFIAEEWILCKLKHLFFRNFQFYFSISTSKTSSYTLLANSASVILRYAIMAEKLLLSVVNFHNKLSKRGISYRHNTLVNKVELFHQFKFFHSYLLLLV